MQKYVGLYKTISKLLSIIIFVWVSCHKSDLVFVVDTLSNPLDKVILRCSCHDTHHYGFNCDT